MNREILYLFIRHKVGDKEYIIHYYGAFGHNKTGPSWFTENGAYKAYRFVNWDNCQSYSIDQTGIYTRRPLKI